MGCCGSGGPKRTVKRQQPVESPRPVQKQIEVRKVQRHGHAAVPTANSVNYSAPRHTCPKCGYPAMTVHIAKRERIQCSNVDCKLVLQ